jgi:hypothetical protein
MSKYDRLGDFLKSQHHERVPVSFADVERITQTKLPASAHKHRPWWSNNATNSVLTRVWLEAGFESEQVDRAGQKLVFRRVVNPTPNKVSASSSSNPVHPLYGALKGMVRIMPGTDLTAPADPDWGKDD